MSWKQIAVSSQKDLLHAIPQRWRIDTSKYESLKDVTGVPRSCGILDDAQLRITELTATDLVKRMRSREFTAVDVLTAFAARTAVAHQLVNCLTAWFLEDGLQQARELDEILEKGGELKGPLHGVPVALKDYHSIKGHATSTGFISRRNNIAEHDSAIVSSLRAAGAVFYCKTTMPQTGMALETVSNLWGRTLNPFNRDLTAGGSSGGDAVLVAMKGCPIAPSTDVGGSIRVPAAFNGLYAIRPTSERIPKGGMNHTNSGQLSIKLSCGPVCHSLDDLETMTRIINAHPENRYDVTSIPVPWREVDLGQKKLAFGIMKWDGVVMPHPPILRALEHAKKALEDAGHEVIEFKPPFDCWDASQTTFDTFYQSGSSGMQATLDAAGEPLIPVVAELMEIYKVREHSAAEALQINQKTRILREKFMSAWDATRHTTTATDGRPIDALLCPMAPALGMPHDFNIYWGYGSLFNLLDYPSTVLPMPSSFRVDRALDPVDEGYRPLETNPFDVTNHELYDPELFANQPTTLQLVARPYDDEELIQISRVVDDVLRKT